MNISDEQRNQARSILAQIMPRIDLLKREVQLLMVEQKGLLNLTMEMRALNVNTSIEEWDEIYWKWSELNTRYHGLLSAVGSIIDEKQRQMQAQVNIISDAFRAIGFHVPNDDEWPEYLNDIQKDLGD